MGWVTLATALSRKMGYKTSKFVKIIDWRLALLNVALQAVIVFYVVYALVRGKTYLRTEVPIGRVTNWGNGNDDFYTAQVDAAAATAATTKTYTDGKTYPVLPCKATSAASATLNSSYAFNYDTAWVYDNVKCGYLTPDEIISKEPAGGMFITTHVTETITHRSLKPSGNCVAYTNFTNSASGSVTVQPVSAAGSNGVCYYESVTDWLTIGAEHSSIGISHEFDTLSGLANAANPKTYVRRPGSSTNLKIIPAGQYISLKLKDILDVANIDLDKTYEDQVAFAGRDPSVFYGKGGSASVTPMARLAGMRINAKLQYYNYNLHTASASDDISDGDSPYAVLEIEPSIDWTSKGQRIQYRSTINDLDDPIDLDDGKPTGTFINMYAYGVFIDVTTSGIIGSVNYVYIINVLVSGLVLLKVAGSICDIVAMYGLGTRSLVYSNHMLEPASFEREAAKYAIQGAMAVNSFRAADTKRSGDGLDIEEIYELLVEAFHSVDGMSVAERGSENFDADKFKSRRLTLDECRQMSKYIMLTADRHAQERYAKGLPRMSYSQLKNVKIDLEEWVELTTEGPMDNDMLRKIIRMDKEEQALVKKMREYFNDEDGNE